MCCPKDSQSVGQFGQCKRVFAEMMYGKGFVDGNFVIVIDELSTISIFFNQFLIAPTLQASNFPSNSVFEM